MKLIKLSSDKKSFHTINFKSGINLIVGSKKDKSDSNVKNTYNGVGKSLIVYLIHFCLGANKIKPFEDKIPDWDFILEFEINGENFVTKRNTSSQKDIYLNDEKHSLKQFREKMIHLNFEILGSYKNLTFNTLFPRFIRRDRESYNKFDNYIVKEQEYSQLLNNAFLLDLDINLIVEKKKLRDFQIATQKMTKSLEKDPVLKEHFSHDGDTEIEIIDLEEYIKSLESELQSFKISNNYDTIEKEADKLTKELKELSNERSLVGNDIVNITRSLIEKPNVSTEKIVSLYNSVKIEVPEMINKKISESISFHKSLIDKRELRLQKELKKCKSSLSEIEKLISQKGVMLDKHLGYLDTHGALDEFSSLNRKLTEKKTKLEKLLEYQGIMKTYKKKLLEIKTDYGSKSIETQEYIEKTTEWIDTIKTIFRGLTKEFYDKGSGIKIESNDGENTLRYNIDVRIQDDSSDGVNEVKILCYDLMILFLQANHKMKFIFHDSRLFSNMDPRQRATAFRLVYKKLAGSEFQYIATVNQDQLNSFADLYTEEEFNEVIEDNIILKLTDESYESKLLGIQIDMKYEK